jgi:ATP-dependent DNA helicase RecG
MSELTVNVQVIPGIRRAGNGGENLELAIVRSVNVASTRDGRCYVRVGCSCQPVVGDDVLRLVNVRPGQPWEFMDARISNSEADQQKVAAFISGIRASDRVKEAVKGASAECEPGRSLSAAQAVGHRPPGAPMSRRRRWE